MNQDRILWLVLLGSPILVLVLMLSLESVGWAAPSRPLQKTVLAEIATKPAIAEPLSPAQGLGRSVAATTPFPNCRYGVSGDTGQLGDVDIVSEFGAGWYINFFSREDPPGPVEAEYVQMVRLDQGQELRQGTNACGPDYGFTVTVPLTDTGLGARVDANPGALWIVGNEPDRINQDDVCPQQYAEAYHDVYHFIKGRDPTAQVAVSGLVEVTPGRLQYLDIVWDTYREKYGVTMPVDVWTMHIYVLSETGEGDAHIALGTDPGLAIPHSYNCADPSTYCHAEHDDIDLFIEQVVAMRQWMKDHYQQHKPLLLAEYSLLKPYHFEGTCPEGTTTCEPVDPPGCFCDENKETFHPQRIVDFMEASFDYLRTASSVELGYPADGHRLVQQWLWFSIAVDPPQAGHCSNLVITGTYSLTLPGQAFRDYVDDFAPEVNLFPIRVPPVIAHAANGTDPVTVTLSAEVMNNGNTAVTEPVTVTFYSDEGLTVPIGSVVLARLGGCARPTAMITTTWESVDSGAHYFWVKVDAADLVAETSEIDNVGTGVVLVNPRQVFLPVILRKW